MTLPKEPYSEAHLFVATVRVLSYQKSTTPNIEDICEMLSCSEEFALQVSRRLKSKGIVDVVETPFSVNVSIADHMKLEELPREEDASGIEEELKKFQESQKGVSKKYEAILAKQARKKQDEFDEMERKLKKAIEESKK